MRSLSAVESTINRVRVSTAANARAIDRRGISAEAILRAALLAAAAAATVTISIRDPRVSWICESAIFAIAGASVWRFERPAAREFAFLLPLALTAIWGFAQLALGATVDRFTTLDASLRFAAFAALAVAGVAAFRNTRAREAMLAFLSRFGCAIALAGVLAYFTSPARLLWIFPSPYPDTWGVFFSRNNFAQFLEVALPAALWRARKGALFDSASSGVMLAAGIASASRAGAILLVAETIVCLALLGRSERRSHWKIAAAMAMCVAISGASQLVGRLRQPDPLELRREIAQSALAMIREHPWRGFGLGSFASVYPAYASFDAGAAVEHAHDDWLEWPAEGGAGFAAAWLALAVALVAPAGRSVWGVGILAVFVHAAVDFPFARLGIAAWVFLLSGALIASERSRAQIALQIRSKS